jgi:hypothetical protein
MANNRVCVGGIDLENEIPLRLFGTNGHHESIGACPFNLREIWDIEYVRYNQRSLPHSEDVRIISKEKSGILKKEISILSILKQIDFPIYEGDILNTFEGKLKRTDYNTLYISEDSVPNCSTCFWISDRTFSQYDRKKVRYGQVSDDFILTGDNFPYVGLEENPVLHIPQGTLVRLSLAHWWAPENSDQGKKCYLQLSGWY